MRQINEGCLPANKLYYADIQPDMDWRAVHWVNLFDAFDAQFDVLGNDDRTVYLLTNKDAPKYRVVSVTLPAAGSADESSRTALDSLPLRDMVPESEHLLEKAFLAAGTQLVTMYLEHVETRIICRPLHDMAATQCIPLPAPGAVPQLSADRKSDYLFLKFTSFLYPGTVLACQFRDVASAGDAVSVRVLIETVVPGFDATAFETVKGFSVAKDGTRVPYFLTRAKTTKESAPTLLYGYGGFNVNLLPNFSPFVLVWLKELGGVYVAAKYGCRHCCDRIWHLTSVSCPVQPARWR